MSTGGNRARYNFEVTRFWKGDVGERLELETALSSAACGRSFALGTTYLIYAKTTPDGRWVDGLCSRTRPLQAAGEDLEVLGAGRNPSRKSSPTGSADSAPIEPPRIEPPAVEPPPTKPTRRGCSIEKPHIAWTNPGVLGLVVAVAIGRRRAVRSEYRGHADGPSSPSPS